MTADSETPPAPAPDSGWQTDISKSLRGVPKKLPFAGKEFKMFRKFNSPQGEGTMKFVVIGADAAGMSAASRAKRNKPDLEVVVFEQTRDVSYSA